MSQETTFERDVADSANLLRTLRAQASAVSRMLKAQRLAGVTVKLKLRWADFTTITRQTTVPTPIDDAESIYGLAAQLFEREWRGRTVRLIGVGVTGFQEGVQQPSLWDQPDERAERLNELAQTLRQRFGDQALRRGSELAD